MSNLKKENLKEEELDDVAGGQGLNLAPSYVAYTPVLVTEKPVNVNCEETPVGVNVFLTKPTH